MKIKEFNSWLACYFHQNEQEVTKLLEDKTATQFLIAWSLLELKLFPKGVDYKKIKEFADDDSKNINLNIGEIDELGQIFHHRYQDDVSYRRLMYGRNCEIMNKLRGKNFPDFSPSDKIYFVMVVVFRYRNNIFHGNKGVDSWLKYRECILKCITIMQLLIPIPKNGPYSD
jgi:hypothetical protein